MNNRQPKSRFQAGVTLLEITLALVILIVAIIPIYTFLSRESSNTLNTEKIQMAEKLLKSIHQELMTTPFRTLAGGLTPDGPRHFPLDSAWYPVSHDKVLELQRSFKDFTIEGEVDFVENDTIAKVNVRAKWTIPGKTMERSRTFTLVSNR
jgi:hypothetical protein